MPQEKPLKDVGALVTGGARGIGAAIAETLAARGASIAIGDIDEAGATETAAAIEATHETDAIGLECDVTVERHHQEAIERAVGALGPLTVFVNNAGGAAGLTRVWETPRTNWDATVELCLTGTFLGTKHAIDHMIDANTSGAIVNVSSVNHEAPTDGMAHYSAAKAGVSQLTAVAAGEAGRHGIRVNAVAPGSTRTPMTEETGLVDGEMGAAFEARTPLGRLGDPDDVAEVVAFLATERARWVTGATIPVDGGQHLRGLHSYYDTLLTPEGPE